MDHLPAFSYTADERTRYSVRIEWADEFSAEPTVETLRFNETLEDAQRAYIKRRDELGLGASRLGFGDVFDERGQHIGRISYNGRLWEPWTDKFLSEAPQTDTNRLYASTRLLEDVVSPSLLNKLGIKKTEISEEALGLLRNLTNALMREAEMQPSVINQSAPRGNQNEIEVLICSQSALSELFDVQDDAMGAHVVNTPESNPFEEDAPRSKKLRVAIAWDNQKVREQLDWNASTEMDRIANAEAWLGTIAHELLHVRLLVENGNFNTPADLDDMSQTTGHDLFDMITSYGIRDLEFDGGIHVAEEAADAAEFTETYCEHIGMEVTSRALGTGAAEAFIKVVELEEPAAAPAP